MPPVLLRRDGPSFSVGDSLKGAIAAAVVIIVAFIVGCVVFLVCYNKASRKPQLAHVGTKANYVSSTESSEAGSEVGSEKPGASLESTPEPSPKPTPESTPESTPASSPPNTPKIVEPEQSSAGQPGGRISRLIPARLAALRNGEEREKRVSGASVDVPETPGKEFV